MYGPQAPPPREPVGLQTPWTRDFHDLSFEWRRLFAEALGTFFLVLAAAGGTVANARSHGQVPLDARVVAPGLMVMAVIYFMGTVSGAHLNPAVTIAFALRRNFPWKRVPGYVAAQLAGAPLLPASCGPHSVTSATSVPLSRARDERRDGHSDRVRAYRRAGKRDPWHRLRRPQHRRQCRPRRLRLHHPGRPVGGARLGGVHEPSSFPGPALMGGHWSDWWAYVVGPLAGAVVAVALAWVLRGPPSTAADQAAQGTLP